MQVKKRESFIAKWVVTISATAVYAFSLSIIVPLALMALFPEYLWAPVVYARPVIFLAVGLVFLSALVLYMYTHSLGAAFFRLGVVTFVPGLLALIFSFFSRDLVFRFIENHVVQFVRIEPYVESYLSLVLPRVIILAVAYLILGSVLIYWGVVQLRKESAVSLAKLVFGPRAKILSR